MIIINSHFLSEFPCRSASACDNVNFSNQLRLKAPIPSRDGHQLTHKSSPADRGTGGSQASSHYLETAGSILSCLPQLSNGQGSHV